jgi:hypothetical protein
MDIVVWMLMVASFFAGGAFIWFCKDFVLRMVIGANALSKKLHDKADAIAASKKV